MNNLKKERSAAMMKESVNFPGLKLIRTGVGGSADDAIAAQEAETLPGTLECDAQVLLAALGKECPSFSESFSREHPPVRIFATLSLGGSVRQIIGIAILSFSSDEEESIGMLQGVFVTEAYRRRGYACAMIEYLLQTAAELQGEALLYRDSCEEASWFTNFLRRKFGFKEVIGEGCSSDTGSLYQRRLPLEET